MSPTRRLVVLGLIGCLGALPASAQTPVVPSRFDPAPFYDVDTATCLRFDRPGEPVSVVGLTEDVDPAHAPIPVNDSERLVFRQVYETLVHIGCDFTIRPGLAATWQLDATGTTWIITLRRDARFSDGTAVTARDVIASWTRGGSTLRPEVARFLRAATALDDLTLSAVLQQPARQDSDLPPSPGLLAQPALAIARFAPESAWPLGTRDVRGEGPDPLSVGGRSTITLVAAATVTTPATAALTFLVSPDRDARDLLDRGVDLLLTRDAATLAYAHALTQFESIPLPWLRSYLFVSREHPPAATLTPERRQELADDAVTGEARGSSYDWSLVWDRCAATVPVAQRQNQLQRPGAVTAGRLAYDRTDSVARSLAERIAALTSARSAVANPIVTVLVPQAGSRKLQAAPLRGADLSSALTGGEDVGYVLAVDRTAGCAEVTSLHAGVPWMTAHAAVPLVDTRLHAIVRSGRSHLAMEWDGSLLIGGRERSQ